MFVSIMAVVSVLVGSVLAVVIISFGLIGLGKYLFPFLNMNSWYCYQESSQMWVLMGPHTAQAPSPSTILVPVCYLEKKFGILC